MLVRHAAKCKKLDIVQYLVKTGCNVNEFTDTLPPALYASVKENSFDITEYLLKNGADPTINFKDQTILSYAIQTESSKMVRLLLNNGAPLGCFQPGIPPLVTALKNQNVEIASLLLSMGADPNSPQIFQNNKPLYPLDISIKNKSSTATTLLIYSGAKLRTISTENIEPATLQQIEAYMEPADRKESSPLSIQLRSLIQEYAPLYTSVEKFIKNLEEIADDPTIELTPILNSIREYFVKYGDYVPSLIQFENDLMKARKPLIDDQFTIFNLTDRTQLLPELKDDIRKWREFFPRTIELLGRNKTKHQSQKNAFIDFCISELTARERILVDDDMLDFGDEPKSIPANTDEKAKQTREKLIEYSDLLNNYKAHCNAVYMHIAALTDESIYMIENAIDRLNAALGRLDSMEHAQTRLTRAGLSQDTIRSLTEISAPKAAVVRNSLSILMDNRTSIEEIGRAMMTLIRAHIR